MTMRSRVPEHNTELSTLTLTFSLVAAAQLALAEGDPRRAAIALSAAAGLRERAGLRAWPAARRAEAELATRVEQEVGPAMRAADAVTGAELDHRDAVALVRRSEVPVG